MEKLRMIIFGCGYVGRELAREAVARGHDVWIHSRNPDALNKVEEVSSARHVIADLHSEDWHKRLVGEWDVVFNLVSSAGGGLYGYELSYIEGNRSIRKWAEDNRVGRFIYTSATSVYPQSDGKWVSEEDVPELDNLSENGRILRRAEEEIMESTVFGSLGIIRLGGIYGPGRHLYLNSLREGKTELPGDGGAYLNLIYLKDIRAALMKFAELDNYNNADIFNLVDNHPARKQEIVDWLASQLDKPSIRFNPEFTGSRGRRRTSAQGMPNRRIRNDSIRQLLDWNPQFPSYREGYADILANG